MLDHISESGKNDARTKIGRSVKLPRQKMIELANSVLGELRELLGLNRVFISYHEDQKADGSILACGRNAPEATAVYVHSIGSDLRAMGGFAGQRALFTGIVSILPGFSSHFWEGGAVVDGLGCSSTVLQTVYSLVAGNASHKLTGVRISFGLIVW